MMRQTLLTSAALLAILTAPSFAQGTGSGPAAGSEPGARAAQERKAGESGTREGRGERPSAAAAEQKPGADRAETRREEGGQAERSTRPDGQERRGAEQRDEKSGTPRGENQRADSDQQPNRQGSGQAEQQNRERRNVSGQPGTPNDANRAAGQPANAGQPGSAGRAATAAQPATPGSERPGAAATQADSNKAAGGAPASGTNTAQPAAAPGAAPAAGGTASRDARTSTETRTETRTEITPERRERLTEIISRDSRDRPRIDFSVNVGTVVPGHVRRRPLPTEIVEIAPRYRGYEYFVAEDEIVIVEPGSHRIVSTVSRSGEVADSGGGVGGGGVATAAATGPGSRSSGGSSSTDETASAGGADGLCRIEGGARAGSGGNSGLAVAVRNPDGRSTDMISLPSGRVIVAVDPAGGCTITVER
jgi:hypothetical protein